MHSLTFFDNIWEGAMAMHPQGCVQCAEEVTQTGHTDLGRE